MITFLYNIFVDIILSLENQETFTSFGTDPFSKSPALLSFILEEIVPGDAWLAQGHMGAWTSLWKQPLQSS